MGTSEVTESTQKYDKTNSPRTLPGYSLGGVMCIL